MIEQDIIRTCAIKWWSSLDCYKQKSVSIKHFPTKKASLVSKSPSMIQTMWEREII